MGCGGSRGGVTLLSYQNIMPALYGGYLDGDALAVTQTGGHAAPGKVARKALVTSAEPALEPKEEASEAALAEDTWASWVPSGLHIIYGVEPSLVQRTVSPRSLSQRSLSQRSQSPRGQPPAASGAVAGPAEQEWPGMLPGVLPRDNEGSEPTPDPEPEPTEETIEEAFETPVALGAAAEPALEPKEKASEPPAALGAAARPAKQDWPVMLPGAVPWDDEASEPVPAPKPEPAEETIEELTEEPKARSIWQQGVKSWALESAHQTLRFAKRVSKDPSIQATVISGLVALRCSAWVGVLSGWPPAQPLVQLWASSRRFSPLALASPSPVAAVWWQARPPALPLGP